MARPMRRSGSNGREDPAARGVQLLVARPARPQGKLLDTVAGKRRMCVAVDEAGHRATAATVDLLDIAAERVEISHASDLGDPTVIDDDVRVLDDVGPPEIGSAHRRCSTSRRCNLTQVPDEDLRHSRGCIGTSSPPARAASTASG